MSEVLVDNQDRFTDYDEYLAGLNSTTPQHQGLGREEYFDALYDPRVLKTSIESNDASVEMPQLAPIDTYAWLNSDFYARKFPEEYEADSVRHFFNIDGVEPSDEVKAGLQDLTQNEGILVFDYPESEPDYKQRVHSVLGSLGIEVSQDIELGTQTYYAGKCHLKRVDDKNGKDERTGTTFGRMISDGMLPVDDNNGTTYHKTLPGDEATKLYDGYSAAFENLNDHPCRQGIDPDEFQDLLTNNGNSMILINKKNGEVTTLCILSDNLTDFDWLNADFYERKFPQEAKDHELIYFPAIYTDTSKRGEAYTKQIVKLLSTMSEYGKHEVIVAFDCCDKNKGLLDWYLARLINKTPELGIEFEVVGVQTYGAFRLKRQTLDQA